MKTNTGRDGGLLSRGDTPPHGRGRGFQQSLGSALPARHRAGGHGVDPDEWPVLQPARSRRGHPPNIASLRVQYSAKYCFLVATKQPRP